MRVIRKRLKLLSILRLFTTLILLSVCSPALSAPVGGSSSSFQHILTDVLKVDGKTFTIEEDINKKVTKQRVRKGAKVHTVKAYGSMYMTFLVSMIATEIWYCNKTGFGVVANFEEVPTCRDELFQMMKDPSMHAGILAMTYTSLAYTKFADRKTKNILIKLLKYKARKPYKILQTFNQHIGMGLGLSVQTIVNSVYNSPGLPQCFAEIKKQILSSNGEDGATESAMETEVCQNAWEGFVSSENGTVSEIRIVLLSLSVSVAITAPAVMSLRFIGLVFENSGIRFLTRLANPTVAGGLIISNFAIEFVDRWLEKYIRRFYHQTRSKNLVHEDFNDLISETKRIKESGVLLQPEILSVGCPHGRPACTYKKNTGNKIFPLINSMKDYNYNIAYRRRAYLNTFIDSQSRWKQKLTGIVEVTTLYKEFMKIIYDIRQKRELNQYLVNEYSFNPMANFAMLPVESSLFANSNYVSLQDQFSDLQLEALLNVINDFIKQKESLNAHSHGIKLAELILKNIEDKNFNHLRAHIQLFKSYLDRFHSEMNLNYNQKPIFDKLKAFFNSFTSFEPYSVEALHRFETKQLTLVEGLDEEVEEGAQGSTPSGGAGRRGIQLTSEEVDALLLDEKASSLVKHSNLKLGNMLLQSACNRSQDISLLYNQGNISKITLPNILSMIDFFDCFSENSPFPHRSSPAGTDFYYNPKDNQNYEILANQHLHSIIDYNGQKFIGFLDFLTSPSVPLRWNSAEEFGKYWESEILPKFFETIYEAKINYYEHLFKEFKLFERTEQGTIKNMNAFEPITETHLKNRSKSERYYENMTPGQTFLDQVRTYQYMLKALGVRNENTSFLDEYFKSLPQILDMLDAPYYYSEPTSTPLRSLNDMKVHPVKEMLGQEKYSALGGSIQKNISGLSKIVNKLEERVGGTKDADYSTLSNEQLLKIIELNVFSELKEQLQTGIHSEIFSDYLAAKDFIFIPTDELELGN